MERFVSTDPKGYAAGDANLYRYCRTNSVIYVDPTGLDTYTQNRNLMLVGDGRTWNGNPISHTFTFTTNSDGSLAHTYSWGNEASPHGWSEDEKEDVAASEAAIKNGNGWKKGDACLDPYVQKAFDELKAPANDHANWWAYWNCKSETRKLISRARELEKADGGK